MAYVRQAAASVADTNKMTISLWFKIPDLAGVVPTDYGGESYYIVPILEFGPYGPDTAYGCSGIWYCAPASSPLSGGLTINFRGSPNSVSPGAGLVGSWDVNAGSPWTNDFTYTWYADPPPDEPPDVQTATIGEGPLNWVTTLGSVCHPVLTGGFEWIPVSVGQWYHLMLAADTSIASSVTVIDSVVAGYTAPKLAVYLNGVSKNPAFGPYAADVCFATLSANDATLTGNENFAGSYAGQSNFFKSQATPNALVVNCVHIAEAGTMLPNSSLGRPDFIVGTILFTIPSFNINLSGKPIGLPGAFNPNAKVQMADVQIWANQYIDPGSHLDKFVAIAGGAGTPVKPSVPAIAFGQQTYLFTGGARTFANNRGTGGPFIKTGSIKSIPSFSY